MLQQRLLILLGFFLINISFSCYPFCFLDIVAELVNASSPDQVMSTSEDRSCCGLLLLMMQPQQSFIICLIDV